MKTRNSLFLLVLATILVNCNFLFEEELNPKLARVGDQVLHLEQIKQDIPNNIAQEDSIKLQKEIVNRWVEQTLMIEQAKLNLGTETQTLEQQVEDYRNSLIIYSFEKEFIGQKLDTNVSDDDLITYYNQNLDNFELRDYVVKVLYVKVEKNAPSQESLANMLRSKEEDLRYLIEDYCRQFASNFMLEDNIWLYFNDLLKEIPIKTFNIESFLKNNQYVELEDESFRYYLFIKDYRLKDSVSPFELEKKRIKSILLNKRKLDLLAGMRKEMYQDALSKNRIEYYNR